MNKTSLYVVNKSSRTFCFYLEGEFKSVIPPKTVVQLNLKSRKNARIGISERLGDILVEEFNADLGSKAVIYNITSAHSEKGSHSAASPPSPIIIAAKVPADPIQPISLDTLYRIMMNKLPEKMDTLRRFSQDDGIRMAGDIGDIDSVKWLTAILKLPEHRVAWPEALRSIGKLGLSNAQPVLRKYSQNEDLDIAFAAIDGISCLQPSSAAIILSEIFNTTGSPEVKKYILFKLNNLPPGFETKALVLRQLGKPEPEYLTLILDIIESKKIIEARAPLEKLLKKEPNLTSETKTRIKKTVNILKERSLKDGRKKKKS